MVATSPDVDLVAMHAEIRAAVMGRMPPGSTAVFRGGAAAFRYGAVHRSGSVAYRYVLLGMIRITSTCSGKSRIFIICLA